MKELREELPPDYAHRLSTLGLPPHVHSAAIGFFDCLHDHFKKHPDCGYQPLGPKLIKEARHLHDELGAMGILPR